MTQIQGMLKVGADVGATTSFAIVDLIAVWQLNFDDSLLSQVQDLLGQQVVAEGQETEVLGYGAVFQIRAITQKTASMPFYCNNPACGHIRTDHVELVGKCLYTGCSCPKFLCPFLEGSNG